MDISSGSCVWWTMTKGWRTCRKQQQSLEASRILQLLRLQEWSYKTRLNTHQAVKEVVPMDNTKLHHIKVNPATEISTHGSRTCIPLTKLSSMGLQFSILSDTLEVMTALVTLTSLLLYSFLLHIFVEMGTFGYLEMVMWSLSRQFPWHILCGASHHCVHGMWESTEFITTLVQKPCKYKTCIQHAAATVSSFVTKKLNDGFENEIVTW